MAKGMNGGGRPDALSSGAASAYLACCHERIYRKRYEAPRVTMVPVSYLDEVQTFLTTPSLCFAYLPNNLTSWRNSAKIRWIRNGLIISELRSLMAVFIVSAALFVRKSNALMAQSACSWLHVAWRLLAKMVLYVAVFAPFMPKIRPFLSSRSHFARHLPAGFFLIQRLFTTVLLSFSTTKNTNEPLGERCGESCRRFTVKGLMLFVKKR